MRGFDHVTNLSLSFHVVCKERLAQWPAFCVLNTTKKPGGEGTSRKIGWGCAALFLKPLPYFRPESVIFPTLFQADQTFDTLFQTWSPGARRVTRARDKLFRYVGVNIKREIFLSPNNEEVANSSKNHTQFKTRVHKPYPISDQNGRNWYRALFQTKTAKKPYPLAQHIPI